MIRDHSAVNLGIESEDFEYALFSRQGGLGKVYQLFGGRLARFLGRWASGSAGSPDQAVVARNCMFKKYMYSVVTILDIFKQKAPGGTAY